MFTTVSSAVFLYAMLLFFVGIASYRRQSTAAEFVLGGRSLNSWLTALSAHASDMSSWLFMGYPAQIAVFGIFGAWTALGLILFMGLNWVLVAPKLRQATAQQHDLTCASYLSHRVGDRTGAISLLLAIITLLFYGVYISAGLMGLGILLEALFGLPYAWGIAVGLLAVLPWVILGGYRTLAWIDLFQGIFLMGVIVAVPLYVSSTLGGFTAVWKSFIDSGVSGSLWPTSDPARSWIDLWGMLLGWGLGYFGQPHILTKFMGSQSVGVIARSRFIGMGWMITSLTAATFVGIVGRVEQGGAAMLCDPETLFIRLVQGSFSPFLGSFFLCAIVATTINAMSSQVLVLASSFSEDIFKTFYHKALSTSRLLVARVAICIVAVIAYLIAYWQPSSVYGLVQYAWTGLGASFGPLILYSLYAKKITRSAALYGLLVGSLIAFLWPLYSHFPAMIPAFLGSTLTLWLLSSKFFLKASE